MISPRSSMWVIDSTHSFGNFCTELTFLFLNYTLFSQLDHEIIQFRSYFIGLHTKHFTVSSDDN